jgi:putative transposase
MTLWQRDRDKHPYQKGELIHHSDAGSQYTSFALAEHLDRAGIAASTGSIGDAYDNALMESTIGLFKTELIKPRRPWKTLSQVELATAEWIDWYCHRRLRGERTQRQGGPPQQGDRVTPRVRLDQRLQGGQQTRGQ